MGYDISELAGGRVLYEPSLDGGLTTYFGPAETLMQIGNAEHDFWLATIGNASAVLTHEWGHIEVYKMLPPPFGPDNPYYLHEIAAGWIEMTSPYFLLTTPVYRENTFGYFSGWMFPLKYGFDALGAPGTALYNKYIYGNSRGLR